MRPTSASRGCYTQGPPAAGTWRDAEAGRYGRARTVAGVQVIEDGEFIAVLHELPDVAEQALAKVKAEFDVLRRW